MKRESEQNQTVYNIIGSFLIGGINFFTAPIFTRMLGTEQYGRFSVAFSWVSLFICIMGFQTKEALATGHIDFKNDYKAFRNSTLLLGFCISSLEIILVVLFLKPFSSFLGYSQRFTLIILLTALSASVYAFAQQTFIFEKKAQINLILSVSLVLLIVALSLLFIRMLPEQEKYIGRILGFTVPYTLSAVICCCFFAREGAVHYNSDYWRYSLTLGLPIIFHELSKEVLGQTDKVMMQQLQVDTAEIGIYSFFLALTGVLSMVREALNKSWRPFYYDYLYAEDYDTLHLKCRNHIELFSLVACAFMLAAKEVSFIMAGEAYQKGLFVLPITVWCVYFTFIHQFPVNFELYHKKTRIVAGGTVLAAAFNIGLNAVLIPVFGMYGAGVATAVSYLLLAVGHFVVASHLKESKYHLSAVAFLPGICALLISTFVFYQFNDLWLLRWSIAVLLGCYEMTKIVKRKSVF